jgi:hypothetical protein
MAVQIQFRRATAAEWTAANTILAEGELGLETDTTFYKIGTGSTAWTSLAYGSIQGALASNAVTTAKILDANVTAAKLASDAVTTAKILDANVTAAKIASSAVTADKIASNAWTTNTVIDAAGDLLVGTASDTLGRIAIGTNEFLLTSNGTTAVWSKFNESDDQVILASQVF